LTLKVNY